MASQKRQAERVSGVPNATYDLISVLNNKLEAIAAFEMYKDDAQDDQELRQLFEQMQQQDVQHVEKLRGLLASRLH